MLLSLLNAKPRQGLPSSAYSSTTPAPDMSLVDIKEDDRDSFK